MHRLLWLTDLHLNFLDEDELNDFLQQVADAGADSIVITGDLAEAQNLVKFLDRLAQAWSCPVRFVLGNHDFYHGSILEVRAAVAQLVARQPHLCYLTSVNQVSLSPRTALVGHDGWADARLGDYERSLVMMYDYKLIRELAGVGKQERWPLLKELGDQVAAHLKRVLPLALEQAELVVVATHVPPFQSACWHEGRISNDEWLPHFTCQAAGDVLLEMSRKFPDRRLLVLCGHTHSPGETWPAANLQVLTGGARYGFPTIQRMLELP